MKAKLSIIFDDLAGSAGSVTAKGNNVFTSLLCRPFSKDPGSNRKSQQREGWRNWGIIWENMSDAQREQWNSFLEDGRYWDEPLNKAPKTGRELFFQACIAKYWSGRNDYMNYTSLYKNNLTCLPVVESVQETGDVFMSSDGDKFNEGQLIKVWITAPGVTELAWDWHNMYLLGYFVADAEGRINIREALERRFVMTYDEYYYFNYAVQLFSGEQLHRSSMFWENGRIALFEKVVPVEPIPTNVSRPYMATIGADLSWIEVEMNKPIDDGRYIYKLFSTTLYGTLPEAQQATPEFLGNLEVSPEDWFDLTQLWKSVFPDFDVSLYWTVMKIIIEDSEGKYATEVWQANGRRGANRYFNEID